MNNAERIDCPHCRNAAALCLRAKDLNHRIDDSIFDYYRCGTCGLIFLHPVPADLGKYYETAYPPYSIPKSAAELEQASGTVRWRVEYVKRYAHGGRLLEIGPSYGGFAYEAVKAGFQVDAIEMDGKCCEFINRNIEGARAIHTGNVVEALAALPAEYSVAALWHNLEHLIDPWPVLEKIVDRLVAGGILVISTPNPDGVQFALFKKYWLHLDAPRHVVLVPQALLTRFLTARGMQRVAVTTTDPDGLALNTMGWRTSPAHAADAATRNGWWLKRYFRGMHWLLAPFERLGQRGAAYTAVYRKAAA